jgi:DNA-directed RNA polymerase subunit RPC12/RpoP
MQILRTDFETYGRRGNEAEGSRFSSNSASPRLRLLRAQSFGWRTVLLCLALLAASLTACNRDPGLSAIETDANGYLCLKCEAKFYTERTVFMGSKCPQCKENTLRQTVGYYCEKDQHLTIRAGEGDRQGAVCEKCQAHLGNAMKSPREKDYKAWGATKMKG